MTSALGASDRIRLIKDIAARLSQESWPLIDLTLQQFKLPWTDQWQSGDTLGYVLKMIADAADEKLLALAAHMGLDTLGVRPTVDPAFWQPGEFRLFVTHLAKHKEQATELQTELRRFPHRLLRRTQGHRAHEGMAGRNRAGPQHRGLARRSSHTRLSRKQVDGPGDRLRVRARPPDRRRASR